MAIRNMNPWSYSYIRKLADEATLLARQSNLRPTLVSEAAINWKRLQKFNIPFIGDYVPEGWERVDEIGLVDKTGRMQPKGNSATMTRHQFYRHINEMNNDVGLGVVEISQTQALVATYRRKENTSQ